MPLGTPVPAQIVNQLRALTRTWAEARPVGVCDILLDQLLDVRPDLKEQSACSNC